MDNKNNISNEEVEHIADLSRIKLSDEEVSSFAREMSDVLGYVEMLQEVDTENIDPVAQVTGKVNVFREDVVKDSGEDVRNIIESNYPDDQDGYIKVKQIL